MSAHRAAGWACIAAALTLSFAACGSTTTAPSTKGDVARVAGTVITQEQLDIRLQSALADISDAGGPTNNQGMLTAVTSTVIGSLIFDSVVAQEASRLHMAASSSQVADRIVQFTQDAGGTAQLQAQLAAAGQSMAGLRDEITSSINEENVESHFAQVRAAQVIQQLNQGATFASLESQYNDSPDTSSKAGQLGTLSAAQISSELGSGVLSAVESTKAGEYTPSAVRNTSGYEIIQVEALTATTWTLREILIAAPQPYTVKERPDWFAEEVYYQIYQDCQAKEISVYGSYARVKGANPCTSGPPTGASPTVSPTLAPGSTASSTASSTPSASPSPAPTG
ncbi:MAG: SurA N-terminal domain-containing protein [Candidatus Dormiibacterota bacterium]